MENQKTILITSPYFPPHGGGLERYALSTATYLSRDYGWRVVMVCSQGSWKSDKKEELKAMTVYHLARDMRFSNTPVGWAWPEKLKAIIKKENPQLINIHTPVPGLGDIASFVGRHIPQVVTYHTGSMKKGNYLDGFISSYEKAMLPFMLRRAAAIICSSDFVRTQFLGRYMEKSETVTPGVSADFFTPAEDADPQGRTLIFVAKLEKGAEYKGLFDLLEAVRILKNRYPDIRLVVAGDGDMRGHYENYCQSIGIEDMVHFPGNLDRQQLRKAYQGAQVFVLPTSNDSQPLVILEAMAAGLPILSTRIGGIPQMVADGQEGFLVEAHDPRALSEKIAALFDAPALRAQMSLSARRRAVAEFDWKKRMESYDRILCGALNHK